MNPAASVGWNGIGERWAYFARDSMVLFASDELQARAWRAWRVLATAAHPDPDLAALEAVWGMRQTVATEALPRYDAIVREQIEQAAVRGGDAPETNNGTGVQHPSRGVGEPGNGS